MATTTLPQSPEAPIMARDSDRGAYPAAPDGLHAAVCVDVIDLGLRRGAWGEKHKVRVVWQLDKQNPDTGRRFVVRRDYTLSLAPKAALRRDLESWRGKAFGAEELAGFNLLKLLGANCQVQTVSTLTDAGQTYANVQAIVPPPRNMPKLLALDYVRDRDRAQPRGNATGFNGQGGPAWRLLR